MHRNVPDEAATISTLKQEVQRLQNIIKSYQNPMNADPKKDVPFGIINNPEPPSRPPPQPKRNLHSLHKIVTDVGLTPEMVTQSFEKDKFEPWPRHELDILVAAVNYIFHKTMNFRWTMKGQYPEYELNVRSCFRLVTDEAWDAFIVKIRGVLERKGIQLPLKKPRSI
ncbi:uncharacterized protein LODBEIA_P17740 [Lodderomyces beijingensis]|uniref:Uncharacterized protein n=1 Tax=Lodderomyces beijingensis TaxID=1775926 RepID=A0ABP0ZK22_9ASCO